MRRRNLMIAMMILIVLAAAITVKALNMAVTRPTVTVKIPYRTGTASAGTTRIVPAPMARDGTLSAGTGDASAGSGVRPAIAP
jgi:hypothetical protein